MIDLAMNKKIKHAFLGIFQNFYSGVYQIAYKLLAYKNRVKCLRDSKCLYEYQLYGLR